MKRYDPNYAAAVAVCNDVAFLRAELIETRQLLEGAHGDIAQVETMLRGGEPDDISRALRRIVERRVLLDSVPHSVFPEPVPPAPVLLPDAGPSPSADVTLSQPGAA